MSENYGNEEYSKEIMLVVFKTQLNEMDNGDWQGVTKTIKKFITNSE